MHQSEDENTRKSADIIAAVVTPKYVQAKFSDYVSQLENHYRNEGPPATIDLRDLVKIASRSGFKLPPEAVSKPIKPGDPIDPKKVHPLFANLKLIEYGGAGLALLLLGLVGLLAGADRRLRAVSKTLLLSSVFILPNALFFQILPDIADTALKNNQQFQAVEPVLKALGDSVFKATAKSYLIAAGVVAGLAVIVFVVHLILGIKKRPPKRGKKDARRDDGGLIVQS